MFNVMAAPVLRQRRSRDSRNGHLLAVANQQDVADENRMVPGLALDRREPRGSVNWSAVAPTQAPARPPPTAPAASSWSGNRTSWPLRSVRPSTCACRLEVDARENAAVEAECMAMMHDESLK